jgi:SAM-dependent methyltransferase
MKSAASSESAAASFVYGGEELDLFAHAINWKRYWSRKISPYLGTNILEVGAGTGTNTLLLASDLQERWICLEPDPHLAARLRSNLKALVRRPALLAAETGDLSSLAPDAKFDTILYIDVLEHIEADGQEMERAYQALLPGGHLIVLSPAHPFLYTAFDKGIGHFRRYTRRTLREAGPRGHIPLCLFYLDSIGFFASLANRLLLRQKLPTLAQIHFWDRYLVPSSVRIDPLLGFRFGKTVIGIWVKS